MTHEDEMEHAAKVVLAVVALSQCDHADGYYSGWPALHEVCPDCGATRTRDSAWQHAPKVERVIKAGEEQ